jgi:hypothetical protein
MKSTLFLASKFWLLNPERRNVTSHLRNQTLSDVHFWCRFAVPQHLELHVGPPSSTCLAGHGGALTQSLVISRRAGGGSKKTLKLRLLIEYPHQGKLLRETADVKDFPDDL